MSALRRPARRTITFGLLLFSLSFVGIGLFGAYRYVWTFSLYRGFPAPTQPKTVTVPHSHGEVVAVGHGQVVDITVRSKALGGIDVPVIVFLPPGYATSPTRHYPTFYLLHGFPAIGGPQAFINVGDVAGVEDTLIAEHRMAPTILVMPSGSPSAVTDEEWADGVRKNNDWATFVARDLEQAISARYRTLNRGASRAIGGLSEGGYGALNIGIHHAGEFGVLESWSGYMKADNIPAIFGRKKALLQLNSPSLQLAVHARALRRAHTYVWFYCGTKDFNVAQNRSFAVQLSSATISHSFQIVPGNHNWGLWRAMLPAAFIAASAHLTNA